MPNRLSDVPPMASARMAMPAVRVARARRAVTEAGGPLRAEIVGLRGLDAVVEEHVWLCVDRTLDDLPVVAWLEFAPLSRQALHEPVPCRVQFYHFHAQAIMSRVLECIDTLLEAQLARHRPPADGEVLPFRPPRR